eukprot:13583271-Ditylum_brightwellii.AAC.1
MNKVVRCKLDDTAEGQVDLGLSSRAKNHYFPKNLTCLQKAYLCNHVKRPNKLTIKNTTVRLCKVESILMHFLIPGNIPMTEDELCNIIYHMAKHDWCNVLRKSGRVPTDLSFQDLVDYFEQIELPNGINTNV